MTGSFSVSPRNVRRTVVRATRSASGDRWHDREIVAVAERRLQARPKPNVFVVSVDVDELAQLTLVVVEPLAKARILLIELVERLGDIPGIDLDNGRTSRERAQCARH